MTTRDDERRIINQLSDFPHVRSKQSKQVLYQKVSSSLTPEQQRKSKKWMVTFPALATVFVLALVFFVLKDHLLPSQTEQAVNDLALETAQEGRITDTASEDAPESQLLRDDMMLFNSTTYQTSDFSNVLGHHVILPSDTVNEQSKIPVVAMDASVMYPVPLTIIDQQAEPLTFYNEQLSSFDFNQLGLTAETFNFGTFSQENQAITLSIDAEASDIGSSTQATVFEQTLRYMFQDTYETVFIENTGGQPIELGPFGEINRIDFKDVEKLSYKYVYTSSGHKFMIPIEATLNGETFITIDEALVDMQEPIPEFNIEPAIPEGVTYTLDLSNDGEIRLTFDEHKLFGDNPETIDMIEAILMTAKSFDFGHVSISIKGLDSHQVGPYSLGEPLPLPVAINPVKIIQ
ncbi:hypothetical protein HMI01_14670 [Halolactibacillus miurensis]|uniref:Sporulation and spore germination n=2 Tax=Halolactibacillus TaxID=306539 RepID=A0A1I6PVP5_9BACI|nr:hypothetical protein [Halolactibacillus miurensis]GEM04479.1 hypothetical protein HMI01_14670 [Halolactibacillus miurensis]SFS44266.1 hypothetical protein SAMN05421668_102233 [Halolactibacillus miurensis]